MPDIDRLTEMADGSQQVGKVQAMADIAQTRQPQAAPSAGSFSFQNEIRQMEGQLTFEAKFNKFIGRESTYSKLIGAIKDHIQAKDAKGKVETKKRILTICDDWTKKHGKSTDANDLQKKGSIERIRQALETPAPVPEKPPVPPGPQPSPVPGAPKVIEPTPAVTIEEQVSTGPDSLQPFEQIRIDFEAYQGMASGTIEGVGALYAACQKLYQVRMGITEWMKVFGKRKDEEDVERRRKLMLIEVALGALEAEVSVQPYFVAHLTGLDVNALAKGIFRVRKVEVSMETSYGTATGEMANVQLVAAGFQFQQIKLAISGNIELMEGFSIEGPSLEISTSGSSYSVSAGGNISLEPPAGLGLSDVSVQGEVTAGYDFGAKSFIDPTVKGGKLNAKIFDTLSISVDALDYAEGSLTAASGMLTVNAMGSTTQTTVGNITYSSKEGLAFDEVTFESPDTFDPVPGLSVEAPRLTLKKSADGWLLDGEGILDVQYENASFHVEVLKAKAAITYSIGKSKSGLDDFSITEGGVKVTAFDNFSLELANISYQHSQGSVKADKGSVGLNVLDKQIKSEVTDVSYGPEGLRFKDLTLSSGETFQPLPGFSVAQPSLKLSCTEAGLTVEGIGKLGFDTGLDQLLLLKSESNARLLYNVDGKEIEEFEITEGTVDLMMYDLVHINGSGITFDKASGTLTIGSATVDINTPGGAFEGKAFSGNATNISIKEGKIDWSSISVDMPGPVSFGGLTFQPPRGIITKDGDSFKVALENAEGNWDVWDILQVGGKVSIEWGPNIDNGVPRITQGELTGGTKSPVNILQSFIPGFEGGVSFETGVNVPFAAGPVPMELNIDFGGKIDASIGLNLKLSYADNAFDVEGGADFPVGLNMYLKLGVGLGSKFVAYFGGFLKGDLDAMATGKLGFEGSSSKDSEGHYKMDKLLLKYGIDANMKASLTGGAEMKALYFFRKEIYEFKLKEWQLGTAEMSGDYNLLAGKNVEDNRSNLFGVIGQKGVDAKSIKGFKLPPNQFESKNYRKNIEKLTRVIDELQMGDDEDAEVPEILSKHKPELEKSFTKMVSSYEARTVSLNKKKAKNEAVLQAYIDSYEVWRKRQQSKLDALLSAPPEESEEPEADEPEPERKGFLSRMKDSAIEAAGKVAAAVKKKPRTPEHYVQKMAKKKVEYDVKHSEKKEKVDTVANELAIIHRELEFSRQILARMNELLKENGYAVLNEITESIEGSKAALVEAIDKADQVEELIDEVVKEDEAEKD